MKKDKKSVIIFDRIPSSELNNKQYEFYEHTQLVKQYCEQMEYEIIKTFVSKSDDDRERQEILKDLCSFIRNHDRRVHLLVNYVSLGHELDHAFYMGFSGGAFEQEHIKTIWTTFPLDCECPDSKILFMDMTVEWIFASDDESTPPTGVEDVKIIDSEGPNAFIYLRCNSRANAHVEFERQEKILNKHCLENNIRIVNTYKEIASPLDFNRTEFLKMLAFIEENPGVIDFIYISSWDRFSRLAGDSLLLIEELKRKGVEVVAVEQILDENIDLTRRLLSGLMNEFVLDNHGLFIHSKKRKTNANK